MSTATLPFPASTARIADAARDPRRPQPRVASITVHCPAKTNLTLRVGAVLEGSGGRHALDTVYCGVGLYDSVTLTSKPEGTGFSLELEGEHLGDLAADTTDMRHNLAVRALFAYARQTGASTDVGIRIVKRIPVAAGLGGGSADAAGALVGLDEMHGHLLGQAGLERLAAELGADVPFCVAAGMRRGTGYGQRLTDDLGVDADGRPVAAPDGDLLLGVYDDGLSTADVYRHFDRIGAGAGHANDLQAAAVALHPRSGAAIEAALANGAVDAFISGSGPTVLAVVRGRDAMLAVMHAWESARVVDRIETARPAATMIVEG